MNIPEPDFIAWLFTVAGTVAAICGLWMAHAIFSWLDSDEERPD